MRALMRWYMSMWFGRLLRLTHRVRKNLSAKRKPKAFKVLL